MREVALNVVEDLAVVALHVDGLAVVALHVDGLAVVALNVDEDLDFAPPNLMREVALNVVEDLAVVTLHVDGLAVVHHAEDLRATSGELLTNRLNLMTREWL